MLKLLLLLMLTATSSRPAIEVDLPEHVKGARQVYLQYSPFPKQQLFHSSPAKFPLFGGAAGPGKSLALVMEASLEANEFPGVQTLLLRRTFPELERGMMRAFREFVPRDLYHTFNETSHEVRWLNGSYTVFGSCPRQNDIYKFQGSENLFVGWDELTQFQFAEWQALLPWNRCSTPGSYARMAGATNPIGPGVKWVKDLWITGRPCTGMEQWQYQPGSYAFIGATYLDNPIYAKDANFIANLDAQPKGVREALKTGSWDVIAGAYFSDVWVEDEVVYHPASVEIPAWATRWISMDWGFQHPSSIHWFAQVGDITYVTKEFVKNRLGPADLAAAIIERSAAEKERIKAFYLSPDAFAQKSDEKPVAEQLGTEVRKAGLPFPELASNDRIGGAQLIYGMLQSHKLRISRVCESLIGTLPMILHDPSHPEDTLKMDGDDSYDSGRYGLYSKLRPAKTPVEGQIAAAVTSEDPTVRAMQIRIAEEKVKKASSNKFFNRVRFRRR